MFKMIIFIPVATSTWKLGVVSFKSSQLPRQIAIFPTVAPFLDCYYFSNEYSWKRKEFKIFLPNHVIIVSGHINFECFFTRATFLLLISIMEYSESVPLLRIFCQKRDVKCNKYIMTFDTYFSFMQEWRCLDFFW